MRTSCNRCISGKIGFSDGCHKAVVCNFGQPGQHRRGPGHSAPRRRKRMAAEGPPSYEGIRVRRGAPGSPGSSPAGPEGPGGPTSNGSPGDGSPGGESPGDGIPRNGNDGGPNNPGTPGGPGLHEICSEQIVCNF